MRIENIKRVFEFIRSHPTCSYEDIVQLLVDLGREREEAEGLLNLFLQACKDFYILNEGTFDELKERILSLNTSEEEDRLISKIYNIVLLYVEGNPEAKRFLVQLEIKELKEQLEQIEQQIQKIIQDQFIQYPPNCPDEVKVAIDFYNQSHYGVMISDLEVEKSRIVEQIRELEKYAG